MSITIKPQNDEKITNDVNFDDGSNEFKKNNHFEISNFFKEYTEMASSYPNGEIKTKEDKEILIKKIRELEKIITPKKEEMEKSGVSINDLVNMVKEGKVPDLGTVSLFLEKVGININTLKTKSGKPQKNNVRYLKEEQNKLENELKNSRLFDLLSQRIKKNHPIEKELIEELKGFLKKYGSNKIIQKSCVVNVTENIINNFKQTQTPQLEKLQNELVKSYTSSNELQGFTFN